MSKYYDVRLSDETLAQLKYIQTKNHLDTINETVEYVINEVFDNNILDNKESILKEQFDQAYGNIVENINELDKKSLIIEFLTDSLKEE